jgi:GNAT superfamily N-acetyltransferase
LTDTLSGFAPSDSPEAGTFEAIFAALDASSRSLVGPAQPRLLVIPIRDDGGAVVGGFWGCTLFQWLHVQMLFVPEALRSLGVGSALMASAEAGARGRGCRGAYVDAFSFQAGPFYRKLGFTLFGVLDDFPPGYQRLYFRKRFDAAPERSDPPPTVAASTAPPSQRRRTPQVAKPPRR